MLTNTKSWLFIFLLVGIVFLTANIVHPQGEGPVEDDSVTLCEYQGVYEGSIIFDEPVNLGESFIEIKVCPEENGRQVEKVIFTSSDHIFFDDPVNLSWTFEDHVVSFSALVITDLQNQVLQREILFVGEIESQEVILLEGSYTENIAGLSIQPLLVQGSFFLSKPNDNITISLDLEPEFSEIFSDQSVEITASLTNSIGETLAPLGNETINFDSSFGEVFPSIATTNPQGRAFLSFDPQGEDGTVNIIASVQLGGDAEIIETSTSLIILPSIVSDLTSENTIISLDNGETSLFLNIRTRGGDPLDGIAVSFSTSLGALQDETILTDSQGLAQTKLFSSGTPGNALVTAAFLDQEQELEILIESPYVNSISIVADSDSIPINESVDFIVSVLDQFEQPLENITVTMIGARGTFDESVKLTNSDGNAHFTFTAGGSSGATNLTAIVSGVATSEQGQVSETFMLNISASD